VTASPLESSHYNFVAFLDKLDPPETFSLPFIGGISKVGVIELDFSVDFAWEGSQGIHLWLLDER
jgi:hypothetical protein